MASSTSAREGVPTSVAALRTSGGGGVPASKDRLSACSQYFKALFFGPLSNPRRGNVHVLRVNTESRQDTAPNCSTVHAIMAEDVQDLTIAAEQFLADSLCDSCYTPTSRNMDVDNSIMVPQGVSFYHLESVHKPDVRFSLAYSDNCDFPA